MKKYLVILFLFVLNSAFTQTLTSGPYTVSISDLKNSKSSGEMYGIAYEMVQYDGNYTIYKNGAKIASQEFSGLKGENSFTVNIRLSESLGNSVTYDFETKLYEFMGEEKSFKNSKKDKDIILNCILYYAELSFSEE